MRRGVRMLHITAGDSKGFKHDSALGVALMCLVCVRAGVRVAGVQGGSEGVCGKGIGGGSMEGRGHAVGAPRRG